MKYTVTFCSMDTQLESNWLWHSCILLSKLDESLQKLEVVDSWGFYGVPSTDHPESWWKKLKSSVRVDVDFIGNHGKWRHEETRYLDRGVGLHGKTFELTSEQFDSFTRYMNDLAEQEEEAIKEAADFLKLTPQSSVRSYPYESFSSVIYSIEQARARVENRPSRLKPFELRVGLDYWGPHVRDAHTCKSTVIKALNAVLSVEQIHSLTENGQHPTVPRYSGPNEIFYLHSTGPMHAHVKKSGQKVSYRNKIGEEGVRVFWTIPPQLCEVLSAETASLFFLETRHVKEAKEVVSCLQQLEWLLHNAPVAAEQQALKQALIHSVVQCYAQFAVIEKRPQPSKEKMGGWSFFPFTLFQPEQSPLKLKIKAAHALLDAIYHAIEESRQADESSTLYPLAPTQVLAFFKEDDQRKICRLLKRAYPEAEAVEEEELSFSTAGYFALDWRGE